MDKVHHVLAHRYAQAYIDLVYDQLSVESIASFKMAADFFASHKQACFLIGLSLLSDEKKQKALRSCVTRFNLPAMTEKLLSLLVNQKRSDVLSLVFVAAIAIYKKRANIETFTVESSLPLSEQQKKSIQQFLECQKIGRIICTYCTVPSLLAGVRIYNENYRWEYSAQAQLRALYTTVRR